jgi:amino-acid N-acetyltransferase
MVMGFAQTADEARIHELLTTTQLPTSDLRAEHLAHFIVMRDNDKHNKIVGVAGLERIGKHSGLVRSIAVQEEYRNRGIASDLYHAIEEHACSMGIRTVFALTTTIADWLTRLGYKQLTRDNAPEELRQTPEFLGLCPDSAVILQKTLRVPSEKLPGVFECAE